MNPVSRLGDIGSGHTCWPPSPIISASDNVFTNNIKTARKTDAVQTHCCGPSCHSRNISQGSPTVFVNNLPVARIGDAINCGGVVIQGSSNVFSN